MSISKYNEEGYLDLTAYEALTTIEKETNSSKYRPLVFICSPYAGNIEYNISRVRGYSRYAVSKQAIPIAPHLLFPQFMDEDDKEQRNLGILMGTVLLEKCKEVWCFGSKITSGMAMELEKAKRCKIRIRYFTDSCEEIKDNAKIPKYSD